MGKDEKKKEEKVAEVKETKVEAVAEAEAPKSERKKASWSFNVASKIAMVLFPGGKTRHFNLTKVTEGMPITQLALAYYGFKQWVMSNSASCLTIEDKIESIEADYKGLVEHGLEFAGEGNIGIIGRVRSNAGTTGAKVQLAKANSLIDLLTKKVTGTISQDEEVILQGLLDAKKILEGKN